jgi:photosystem II stability/assembly factor-like uncharacterized protein
MSDIYHGWAVGGERNTPDRIYRTQDGGYTWRDISPAEPVPGPDESLVADAFFYDAQRAWVAYGRLDPQSIPETPIVWRTQDGGQSWQASQPLPTDNLFENYHPSDLQFTDPQTGWLLVHMGVGMNHDYVSLFRSQDGGLTWARLLDPYGDGGIQSCTKTAVYFTSPTTGWILGDCQGVAAGALLFQTADGGATWNRVDLPEPPAKPGLFTQLGSGCGVYFPRFFSLEDGLVAVLCTDYANSPQEVDAYLYMTQDGGQAWTVKSYPGGELVFLDTHTGWAFGAQLNRTRDGGASWEVLGSLSQMAHGQFVDLLHGWAIIPGDPYLDVMISHNELLATTDGGVTWSSIQSIVIP